MAERFSASVAARHMACPASANLELAIPNWTPPVVDDKAGAKGKGTYMHEILAPMMELSAGDLDKMVQLMKYVADLRATRRFNVLVEQKMQATWLDSAPFTTPDLVLYTQDEIHVLDHKWGRIFVDPFENKQLLFYAVCAAPFAPRAKGVTVHILQPYANNYTSWFVDTVRLAQFMDDAVAAEKKILNGDTTFGPSDHCTFCPANPHSRGDKGKPLCPAMMSVLYPDNTDEDAILDL